MKAIQFILYVQNQEVSTLFYQELLQLKPTLNVPGMTEFTLDNGVKLGLMPENGIANILIPHTSHPSKGSGIPRCELYLKVEKADDYVLRGLKSGAQLISDLQERDWGDRVGYLLDTDGHVIALAESI